MKTISIKPSKRPAHWALGLTVLAAALSAQAASSGQPAEAASAPWLLAQVDISDEQIYGSQLMSAEERSEYRTRWRTARTEAERAQIRSDHHEKMKARARERGVTLPDEPPTRGGGAGPGGGMGGGPGPGAGPGPGPR